MCEKCSRWLPKGQNDTFRLCLLSNQQSKTQTLVKLSLIKKRKATNSLTFKLKPANIFAQNWLDRSINNLNSWQLIKANHGYNAEISRVWIQRSHPPLGVFVDQWLHSWTTKAVPIRLLPQMLLLTNAAAESRVVKDAAGGPFSAKHIPRLIARRCRSFLVVFQANTMDEVVAVRGYIFKGKY